MHDLLTRRQAAEYLGLSVHTIDHHIHRGQFPLPDVRAGDHATAAKLWLRQSLDEWDQHRRKIPGPIPGDQAA